MDNEKLSHIQNVLFALDLWFTEGREPLHGGALLLAEEGLTIEEAIKQAYEFSMDPVSPISREPIVPRSQRRKIWYNRITGYNGYIGRRLVQRFRADRDAAHKWLEEGPH